MLNFNILTGDLDDQKTGLVYANKPYFYSITGQVKNNKQVTESGIIKNAGTNDRNGTTITVLFQQLGIELSQTLVHRNEGIKETLVIRNRGVSSVSINKIEAGFCVDLSSREKWRLCAIPFRVQLDGTRHDYSLSDLSEGRFKNSVFEDNTRKFMPPLQEENSLRSEAWAWGKGDQGLVVIKYNPQEVELSVATVHQFREAHILRFGGIGFCLYGEPTGAHWLEAGKEFVFGSTYYIPYDNGLTEAYKIYRDFLDEKGHTFPSNYNPPINWNELYDVGWYHSRTNELKQFYTREALLKEAEKAKDIGCELLYLDPGWEVCEGTTLWDEGRLGTVKSFVNVLKMDYGLDLGYRSILRTYKNYWPEDYLIKHNDKPYEAVEMGDQSFWEVCLCDQDFWNEKLKRILEISRNGIKFMMVDEFDWRGPCFDTNHGHHVPTSPIDHVMAVYKLCREIRKACPGLMIEAHDPVWPWSSCIYVPTYFQQGFGEIGSYDENWSFEYMWDCLNDLKSGRVLALYYYNLGCNVPIYLHITMAADNDNCIFFWWVASTVRHLGIGGKTSSRTIEPPEGLPKRDPEKRFGAYKQQMKFYKALKPYFVRGTFHGIAENVHLHTLNDKQGGVLNLFNLTDEEQDIEIFVPNDLLKTVEELPVIGARATWGKKEVQIQIKLKALSPSLVCIGDAVDQLKMDGLKL